jgi:hypothetical protein
MINVLNKIYRENQNTLFFPGKSCRLLANVRKSGEAREATETNMAGCCMLGK